MADEEKEEQIIVIEDLEEETSEEEPHKKEEEKEKKQEIEEETSEENPPSPVSKKKRLIFFVLLSAITVVSVLILYFIIFGGSKEKPKQIQHKEKIVRKKAAKKHKVEKKVEKKINNLKKYPYNPVVDVHFISAMRLQEKGNYHAAINELKRASLDLYLSYYGIGYIYLKMGDVKKAKEYLINKTENYLKLTLENNPDYIEGYINLFRIYMASGNYTDAKKILSILNDKAISKKELATMGAYYDFVVNNKLDSVENLAKKYPNIPLLNGLAGDICLEKGELMQAKRYLKKALGDSYMGSLYYNKMLADVEEEKYKKAMNYIPKTYYMDFAKIACKNYLSFFLLLHERKFKAAYQFLNLNKKPNLSCYSHFKIVPVVKSNITPLSLIIRKNVNYMFAAEILNMYLKPAKFKVNSVSGSIKLGDLYESLGLPVRAKITYSNTASFAEAALLSERAVKFYAAGDLRNALLYYKKALKKVNTSPILLYNAAVIYMKLHDLKDAYPIITQLRNAYPNFPLPYLYMFIIRELNGDHKDALKNLGEFVVKLSSLQGLSKDISDLGFIASFIQNNTLSYAKNANDEIKKLFLLIKAAIDNDFAYLNLNKQMLNNLSIGLKNVSILSVLKYFHQEYPTDYIKRTISDYYLMSNRYEDAYRALFGINQYTAIDYYKLGIAYLLDGYTDAADNFFTKSILLGDGVYDAYMAKVILQAENGDLHGVVYYLKLILKKERVWFNTDVYLSFNIELQ